MDVTFPDGRIRATAGDVLLYHAGVVHEEFATKPSPLETYFVAFETGDSLAALPQVTHDTDGRIRLIAGWLYQDRDLPEAFAARSVAAQIRLLVSEMERLNSEPQHSLVMRTRRFVREHIEEPLSLDLLAGHVRMSKFHFVRRYRELSGRSPAQDVRMMRLEYARSLLLTTDLPLKTIAPMAGLGNVYHLSRMFRKYLNLTTREVRSHRPARVDEEI